MCQIKQALAISRPIYSFPFQRRVCAGTGSFFITTIENGRRREGSACYLDGKEQQAKDESSATLTAKPSMAKPRIRTRRQMHVKIDGAEKKFPFFFFLKQYNSIILPA
jgi:hypothetical protein